MKVVLTIDSYVSFNAISMRKEDPRCILALEKRFKYSNPEYYKLQSMGYGYAKVPKILRSYKRHKNGKISFSRGCLKEIKKIIKKHGHVIRVNDQRLELDPVSFDDTIILQDEQKDPVRIMLKKQQGILRGPCSSGKTVMLLKAIAIAKQPTTVIVWDTNHQKQWLKEVKKHLNVESYDIGGCGGIFKKPIARKINLCMQQSLFKKETLEYFADRTGFVAGDECFRYGARTYQQTINNFPAKYRLGVSANERRKDGKQFLIYDGFGKLICDMKDEKTGSRKIAHTYLIPTKFKSEEYEDTGNWLRLMTEMSEDKERNRFIFRVVERSLKKKKFCIIFTERRAQALLFRDMFSKKYRTGLLIGNVTKKEIRESGWPKRWKEFMFNFNAGDEFDRIKRLGEYKELDVIIATQKGDAAISIVTLDHGFVTTPTGTNIDRFNQQKGRVERDYNDVVELEQGPKPTPRMYYFWDTRNERLQKAGNAIMKKYPKTMILRLKKKKIKK